MPGWSTEAANEFIRLGLSSGQFFDQMQLQKLVYIAHGWCLAITSEPLTGDRPEAWEFGPVYRRLADSLAPCGLDPVTDLIEVEMPLAVHEDGQPGFEPQELDIVARTFKHYGAYSSAQLSTVTRAEDAPWKEVYGKGEGQFRDISHVLVMQQFVRLAEMLSSRIPDARVE